MGGYEAGSTKPPFIGDGAGLNELANAPLVGAMGRSLGRVSTAAFTGCGVAGVVGLAPAALGDVGVLPDVFCNGLGAPGRPAVNVPLCWFAGLAGGFWTSESVRNIPLVWTSRHSSFPV